MSSPDINGSIDFVDGPPSRPVDISVRLEDTTMLDAPSIVMAETHYRLEPGSTQPVAFVLSVPDEAVEERRQYTLSARAGYLPAGADDASFGTVLSYPWRLGSKTPQRLRLHSFDRD
ncbi:YbaY family lipoprotein [Mesorhizobium neociceri]|uniref:YbaY family lipoprotein n=1 Tax=Mesorhizobium neociceri TaxID=1307853 RepID=A0A838BCT3_9HYPH|nr:YbaY family lipoprotein [Mesorhizobium neociceri]MBA1144092.1 YbaY family lipoprotein [Mesorhizobium neociceri]